MFRLLGFDVHVRTGFVVFLALIVFLYQDAFGLWLAGGIAAFTLVHELGHAVAARSAGAHAEISLEFLAGYTSFSSDPARPLSAGQRALISVAGPAVHIVASAAVLVAMGVNPFSLDSVGQTDQAAAIWWAGPAVGAMNLIPVLPLDGGHLALTGVETVVGDKAVRYMAIGSLVVTVAGAVYMFGTDRPGFALFIAFLLINQIQILTATGSRRKQGGAPNRAAAAEARAWSTGRPGILEPGQRISPWYEAHRALLQGDEGGAMGVMLADLRSTSVRNWAAPGAATAEQLKAIVDVLPADLPHGNPYSARVLAEILLALGDRPRAGNYAAAAFAAHRHAPLAVVVARAAAATGDPDNAVKWLTAAADAAGAEGNRYIGLVMDQAPELATLRARPDYEAIRSRVA